MSNIKVSQLPQGTVPLSGGEQIPLVQAGQTVKINPGGLFNGADLSLSINVPISRAIGILDLSHGGTGGSVRADAFINLAPEQSPSTVGCVLTSNGQNISWQAIPPGQQITLGGSPINGISLALTSPEVLSLSGGIDLTSVSSTLAGGVANLLSVVNGGVPTVTGVPDSYVLTALSGQYSWEAPEGGGGGVPSATGVTNGWVLTANAGAYDWAQPPAAPNIGTTLTTIQYVPFGSGGVGTSAYAGNIAIGDSVLSSNTSGINNIGIGTNALNALVSTNSNLAIGNQAAAVFKGSGSLFIGPGAGSSWLSGINNVVIGAFSGIAQDLNLTTASNMFIVANASGQIIQAFDASGNIYIGYGTQYTNSAIPAGLNNTIIGNGAGSELTTGSLNTVLGTLAGDVLGTGRSNTFIGQQAGSLVTSGSGHVIIGTFGGVSKMSEVQNPINLNNVSNNIIFSDGSFHLRGMFDENGSFFVGSTPGTVTGRTVFSKFFIRSLGSFDSTFPYGTGSLEACNSVCVSAGTNLPTPDTFMPCIRGYYEFLATDNKTIRRVNCGSVAVKFKEPHSTGMGFTQPLGNAMLANNATPLEGSGEFFDSLQPKSWGAGSDSGSTVGFLAQDLEEQFSRYVMKTEDLSGLNGEPDPMEVCVFNTEVFTYLIAEIKSLRARLLRAGL